MLTSSLALKLLPRTGRCLALGVLAVNILLSFIDHFGLIDFLVLLFNLVTLLCLVAAWRKTTLPRKL